MPRQTTGLTIGLVAISVIATFAAVTFYMGRSTELAKRLWVEAQLEGVLRVKAALENEKEELTKTTADLEAKVQGLDAQIVSLQDQAGQLAKELAEEKRAAGTARDELAAAKTQMEETQGRLEAERREKLSVADELVKARQDTKRLQDELGQLRQAKEALERRVKEIMTGEGTPETIVVTPSGGALPAPARQGLAGPAAPAATSATASVLVVNPEFNFIVVSLGTRDGLKAGQFLDVLRADTRIAKVQVERVYENMAAANILPEASKETIREGDQVRRATSP